MPSRVPYLGKFFAAWQLISAHARANADILCWRLSLTRRSLGLLVIRCVEVFGEANVLASEYSEVKSSYSLI